MSTDIIEKEITLKAPRSRVWRALTDAKEFGKWFGVRFESQFSAGAAMRGTIVPTEANADIAAKQKAYEGAMFDITIDRIEPETHFSFRWHPFAIDPKVDYSKEPTTLVSFTLEDVEGGTRLTVLETGFDKVPLERRAKAFAANSNGWEMQMSLIAAYLHA